MAGKRLPKDIDLTQKINPADGFFSSSGIAAEEPARSVRGKITAPEKAGVNPLNKNVGGRPRKKGLKNEQFTLTMDPELYEKLRMIAKDQTGGNVSALIDSAVKTYCKVNDIDLKDIEVDPADLEVYRIKQEKKRSKKKTNL